MGKKKRSRASAAPQRPRAALDGGVIIRTPHELEAAIRNSADGVISPDTAMRVAAVYACVRIISGAVATLPLHLKRRVDERIRSEADDLALWSVLKRKPNRWQTPSAFRRMQQAHVLLRGNAFGKIVRALNGDVIEILPIHPDRVVIEQNDDMSLTYVYTRKDGRQFAFKQSEVMHLPGMTLDGVRGLPVISFARETIGGAMAMEEHGSAMFRNGARVSGVLRHPGALSPTAHQNLKSSLDEYAAGGSRESKVMVLEEGMEFQQIALTAEDAQWIESRKFSRSDIAMFFGVPPHMIGDTEKSTSWGSGIEQQSAGFVAYTLEDHLTTWEETINLNLVQDPKVYARFERSALVRGDIEARWKAYVSGMQWGVWSPNEVRALEDQNPRDGGDIYYPPPNTAGVTNKTESKVDDPQKSA